MSEGNNKVNREPDWAKVHKDYKEWIKKITIIPAIFYNILFIVGLIAAAVFYKQKPPIWFGISLGISMISIIQLVQKEGHKQGYIDGYRDGYDQGRDDVLGIDDETRHFIDIESKI